MLITEKNIISTTELQSITIDELRDSKQLSVRASNCCIYSKLYTLKDLIDYFQKHHSFLEIRNAGKKISQELEEFCINIIPIIETDNSVKFEDNVESLNEEQEAINKKALKDYIQNNLIEATEEKLINKEDFFNYVSEDQRSILKNRYLSLIPKFSVRIANRLKEVGFKDFVINYLFANNEALLNIKHLGKKSYFEAIDFKAKFREEVVKIFSMTKEDFEIEAFLKDNKEILEDEFIYNFYLENKHLPMFWRLEKEYRLKLNDRDIDILLNSFPIFEDCTILTLNEIGKKHNITRERARQIRFNILEKKINQKSDVTKDIKGWDYYKSFFEKNFIIWSDDSKISEVLKKEDCNLSTIFAYHILCEVCKSTHQNFGDYLAKYSNWNKCVLISHKYSDIFDFDGMRDDFDTILTNNQIEYLLDIEEYIKNSHRWINFDFDKINDITTIVKDILLHEFGLYVENIDGKQIRIPANKERNPLDVVYEILQTSGKPMHLEDIFFEFKKIMPEHKYTQENNSERLRPFLQRHEKISYRNRSSIYTLTEWENIKTGTIRDAIVEFLLENDLPQTANDITENVLQFFPETNIASIRTTMLNDTLKRFVFFGDGLFGLNSKVYPANYKIVEQTETQRLSFEQRIHNLELFIVEEGHFPFQTSGNPKENSLGRWWYRINNDQQQINNNQQAEVNRVKSQYAEYDTDKITYEWNLNYNKLKCFLLENKRMPSTRGDEKFLNGWLGRAKDDFKNYKLTEEQRLKFIDLTKLI